MNLEIPRVTGWFTVEAGVQMDVVTNWIPQIPLTCWLQSYWVISYLWLRCILGISRPLAGCSRLYGIGACSRLLRLNPSTWNAAGKCSRSCLRTIHSAARTVQGLGRLCASHAWLGQASIHIASTGSSGSYGHRHRSWPWQRAQSSSAQHPCTCRSRRSCVPMSSDRSHHQAMESSCLPWPPSSHGALDSIHPCWLVAPAHALACWQQRSPGPPKLHCMTRSPKTGCHHQGNGACWHQSVRNAQYPFPAAVAAAASVFLVDTRNCLTCGAFLRVSSIK